MQRQNSTEPISKRQHLCMRLEQVLWSMGSSPILADSVSLVSFARVLEWNFLCYAIIELLQI